jgi:hypothetical protein
LSHDFDPAWDYPVIEMDDVPGLSPEVRHQVREAISQMNQLGQALGFQDIEVFFVEPMGLSSGQDLNAGHERVAVYCSGTSSRPVLGLDLALITQVCEQESLNLVEQIRLSVAHELAHAYQESLGLDHEHPEGFDEDDAETFARSWVERGELQMWRLTKREREQAAQCCAQ